MKRGGRDNFTHKVRASNKTQKYYGVAGKFLLALWLCIDTFKYLGGGYGHDATTFPECLCHCPVRGDGIHNNRMQRI